MPEYAINGMTGRIGLYDHATKTWIDEVDCRIDALTTLPKDWDSYGAGPISASVATSAKSLARVLQMPPRAVPGADGSIQLEWHAEGWDVEIVLSEDDTMATAHMMKVNR